MKGFRIKRKESNGIKTGETSSAPVLIARMEGLEISLQKMSKGSLAWLSPDNDSTTIEVYTVLDGKIEVDTDEGTELLSENDSVYINNLEKELPIRVLEDTKLLYITNQYRFDGNSAFQENLDEMMHRINDKDNYTYQHCLNVMHYSVQILRKMGDIEASVNDLVTAAIFHDVGKCRISDEILKKTGKLTSDEWGEMTRHPVFSAELLRKNFGEKIAKIAFAHHERQDGTGYPAGLKGDEIPVEAQIIAVADSFDAMTSVRVYQKSPRKYIDAVNELCEMGDKYNIQACYALRELVLSGEIEKKHPEN